MVKNKRKETREKTSANLVSKLVEVFKHRTQKNGNYSLRAYARDLKIEPSLLSKILRHKYALTETMIKRLSSCLGLSELELQKYLHEHYQQKAENWGYFFWPIATEHLKDISDTHCLDILKLAETADFKYDTVWISKRLDIPIDKVKESISRLMRLGYLKIEDGKLTLIRPQHQAPHLTLKKEMPEQVQAAYLKKALEVMHDIPPNERNQSSITFAVDKALIAKIDEETTLFLKRINQLAASGSNLPNDVYHLSLVIYPVTKKVG